MDSIDSEAVEQAVSPRAAKIFLTAASTRVRRVPRRGVIAAAGSVMMSNTGTPLTAARPVIETVRQLGARFEMNSAWGKDFTLADLRQTCLERGTKLGV